MVNEHPPHQPRGNREEVCPILPVDALRVHQPHVRLVHQRSGLQRVTRPLVPHAPFGDAVQLGLQERDEPVQRFPVTVPPRDEQTGHVCFARRVEDL